MTHEWIRLRTIEWKDHNHGSGCDLTIGKAKFGHITWTMHREDPRPWHGRLELGNRVITFKNKDKEVLKTTMAERLLDLILDVVES